MRGRQLYCAYYIQAMVCVNDLYPFKLNFLCTYVQVVEKAFSWRYHLRNEMAGKGVIYSMWLSRSSWTLALMSSCGKKRNSVHTTVTQLPSSNLIHTTLSRYEESRKCSFSLCVWWLSHRNSSVGKEIVNN